MGARRAEQVPAFLDAGAPERVRGDIFESQPASGRQEVVIHTPRHRRSLSELAMRELHWIAEAWQARAAAAREQGFPYVQALINEGRAAGASLAHSHSQLVWLPDDPPLVAQEGAVQAEGGDCVLCRMLGEERDQRIRVVDERDGLLLLCPSRDDSPTRCSLLRSPARTMPSRALSSVRLSLSSRRGCGVYASLKEPWL